jgi:hypothetical protein
MVKEDPSRDKKAGGSTGITVAKKESHGPSDDDFEEF